jgi:hypothetical protein
MEQTKTNAGAFVDEASRTLDNGFRNLSNNMAFELFYGGTASRGTISSAGTAVSGTQLTFTLANPQQIVQFEVGMSLQGTASDGGAALTGSSSAVLVAQVVSVNRGTGQIVANVIQDVYSATWPAGTYLQVYGDIGTAGAGTIAGLLGLSGLAAWVPAADPLSSDNFWGVNRSSDATRLGGLRYVASSQNISEGITNALAFGNREGAAFDLIVLDFVSYSTLINELGAKVQYVQLEHDEVEVAFEAIHFHSA